MFAILLCFLYVLQTSFSYDLYKDASQPISQRVDDLMKQMTLKEKIYQLLSWDHTNFPPQSAYQYGIGRLDIDPNSDDPSGIISYRNSAQLKAVNESRLHIPASFHTEANHGSCAGGTVFPMPVLQGCTWNPSLVRDIYSVVAHESRLVGNDVLYAPVINMWSDPRFGRNSEAYSANPTLTAFYAMAATNGIQNNANGVYTYLSPNNAIALGKHFAAYGPALGGLNGAPSDISARTMFEIYLKPWRAFASVGGRAAMASHQTYERVPMHANSYIINDVFRTEFGFGDGQIVSDCNDIGVLQNYRIANNKSQAAARGLIGGVDLDLICGNPSSDAIAGSYLQLESAINSGWITEDTVDMSCKRVLAGKFAVGLFDNETYVNDVNAWKSVLDNSTAQSIAYETAVQGITLLQNRNKLYSLKSLFESGKLENLAFVGPLADCNKNNGNVNGGLCGTQSDMLGPYTSANGNTPIKTVMQAFLDSSKYNSSIPSMQSAQGVDVQSHSVSGIAAAVTLAGNADAVVAVIGDSGGTCGEWGDNDNLDPPGMQLQFLKQIANVTNANGIPLVVVLIHGRSYTFGASDNNAVLDDIDLLFSAWRCGEKCGEAIRDIVMGDVENSGRLAQNWPRAVGDINSGASPWLQEIRGKWVANGRSAQDVDGRVYDTYQNEQAMFGQIADPLFALGFGLSNSGCDLQMIRYSNLNVKIVNNSKVQSDDSVVMSVNVDVINDCSVDATDVIQVYLQDPMMLDMDVSKPILVRYWKRLIGFGKETIKAKQSKTVSIDVRFDNIAIYIDEQFKQFELIDGEYVVRVGNSSRTDSLNAKIQISSV